MPQDTKNAIVQVIVNFGGKTQEEALHMINGFTKSRRLYVEAWT